MAMDKTLLSGSTTMLILKLIENKDMYGYQMIEELAKRSDNTFTLKAGTLYPILHSLERQGMVTSYDEAADHARIRKYYSITQKGRGLLDDKKKEWSVYANTINKILESDKALKGGACLATV